MKIYVIDHVCAESLTALWMLPPAGVSTQW